VRVHDDAGHVGIGSGDAMHGFAGNEAYFLGEDPLDHDRHAAVLANIGFHAGRPWPLDVALWDLAGQVTDRPVWHLLGGSSDRVRVYASSGTLRSTTQTVAMARAAQESGFPALKIRFGRDRLSDDLNVLRAVRDVAGTALDIMVDCNQGWRMPWDTRPPWDLDHAVLVGEQLAAEHVAWMEEPLHRGDYAGHRELRAHVDVPIAGGEMTREPYEFDELLHQECLDVYQPDCVCTQGITGLRRLARAVEEAGHVFTPHTWGNGIGLAANAHLTAGATTRAPYLEFPFDPPEWTTARRDFLLSAPIEAEQGWITLSDRPGLGIRLDEAVLESTATAVTTYS
jgi:L-alanine-DL-glutamate epimerase-like enolase superfamily enzyme